MRQMYSDTGVIEEDIQLIEKQFFVLFLLYFWICLLVIQFHIIYLDLNCGSVLEPELW